MPTPTSEQLRVAASGLSYRFQQLVGTTLLTRLPWPSSAPEYRVVSNARIESALVNARAISYLLIPKPDKGSVHFSHFEENWQHPVSESARTVLGPVSQYLAHPALRSLDRLMHPGEWPLPELALVLGTGFADLVESWTAAAPWDESWFQPDPRVEVSRLRQSNLTPTPLSSHPDVARLTEALQAYLNR